MKMKGKKSYLLKSFLGVGIVVCVLLASIVFFAATYRTANSSRTKYVLADINNPKEKAFVIVTPSYNNKEWCKRNLESILSQDYSNYRLIYIDDASTDGTGEIAREHIEKHKQSERTLFIQNKERIGALANFYQAIAHCDPREIVVEVDGDDWLANTQVLAYLNEVYQDPEVWVTYGQFVIYPTGQQGWAAAVPQNISKRNAVREYRWLTTHLRTYYAGLFQKIEKQDLIYTGDFFPMSGDLARMFPIVEMAGSHCRYIPKVLYVYNIASPLNDHTKNRELQQNLEMIIRTKKRYQAIQNLW